MHPFLACQWAFGKPACRLGLAVRGDTELNVDDVHEALAAGVNFLNWPADSEGPGRRDAMSEAIASLGGKREGIVICVQFAARTAAEAKTELRSVLDALGTDYVDLLTFYYVEHAAEWDAMLAPGGALQWCEAAKRDQVVRRLGVTTHQRRLAASMARGGRIDALMIRYNAAHRGAEKEVFPVIDAMRMPVVAYTALRWGALLRPTPDDPPGFIVPRAPAWYRFVLDCPSVAVVLAAPGNAGELREDLQVLDATGPMPPDQYAQLAAHGARVRRHAGTFP